MQEYLNENFLDFSKNEEEIIQLYGNAINDKLEIAKNEIYIEELADSVILKIDEAVVSSFDFSDNSIDYLDRIIDDGFENSEEPVSKELVEELAISLGAYLGTTIINNLGGYWKFRKDLVNSSVYFESINGECFPFHKIIKRILEGKKENISNFYVSIMEFLGVSDY